MYFDTSSLNDNEDYSELKDAMLCYAAIVKYPHPESNAVLFRCPYDCDFDDKFSIYAMGFDFSLKVQVWNAEREEFLFVSLEEAIREYCPEILDLPRLTEEEFYKIPRLFTYKDNTYPYEEGQTWGEWVNSSYNTIGVYAGVPEGGFVEEFILEESYLVIIDNNTGNWIKPSDLIQSNIAYSYSGTMPM